MMALQNQQVGIVIHLVGVDVTLKLARNGFNIKMAKDAFEIKLERKIRHHSDMRWRHVRDPVQRDYHDKFRAATEKELAEYKKERLGK
jgi:hypothetical protein